MTAPAEKQEAQEPDEASKLEAEVEHVLAACEGDPRAAIRALITFAHFQEAQLAEMRGAVSHGFARGRFLAPAESAAA